MIGALLDALGLRAPARVRHAGDLRAGKAIVFGTVHAAEPIRSPIHDKPCAAFYYRCSHRRASRVKGFAQALLRDALTYADGLTVRVDEVEITLRPANNTAFGREDHRALVAQRFDGFKASEKRVPQGGQVAVHGKLRRRGAGWEMVFEQLDHQGSETAKRGRARR